jgi:hypothetical protein
LISIMVLTSEQEPFKTNIFRVEVSYVPLPIQCASHAVGQVMPKRGQARGDNTRIAEMDFGKLSKLSFVSFIKSSTHLFLVSFGKPIAQNQVMK